MGRPGQRLVRDRLALDVVSLQPLHESRCLVAAVGAPHGDVTTPHERLAGHLRPADRHHRRLVVEHGGDRPRRRVVVDLAGDLPCQHRRVVGGQQAGTHRPQRTDLGMPLDDSSTGDHQVRTVGPERCERRRSLANQRRRVSAPRALATYRRCSIGCTLRTVRHGSMVGVPGLRVATIARRGDETA